MPWLGWACGECRILPLGAREPLPDARFTGYDVDGGYAEVAVADERFCFPLPADAGVEAAPLLCAGLIGYRALRMCGDAERLGLYGFGASAHIDLPGGACIGAGASSPSPTRATPRAGVRPRARRRMGGRCGRAPPEELDAAIIFAPVGELVPVALRALAPGGSVVCAGIHMSDIPSFPYEILWGERQVRSVANLTREDGERFLELAPQVPVRARTTTYPLERANEALEDMRSGRLSGSAVLTVAE